MTLPLKDQSRITSRLLPDGAFVCLFMLCLQMRSFGYNYTHKFTCMAGVYGLLFLFFLVLLYFVFCVLEAALVSGIFCLSECGRPLLISP